MLTYKLQRKVTFTKVPSGDNSGDKLPIIVESNSNGYWYNIEAPTKGDRWFNIRTDRSIMLDTWMTLSINTFEFPTFNNPDSNFMLSAFIYKT